MDFFGYVISGAVVGFIVGLTGVGGGALMTPLLMFTGVPAAIAVGTDLLFAAVTKASGMVAHARQKNIDWPIVLYMAAGSIPASLLTGYQLKQIEQDYSSLLTSALGIMLIATSFVLFIRSMVLAKREQGKEIVSSTKARIITFFAGIFLGVFVTLTSVGAGAFGTALLMTLFPLMAARKVVGTDIAHAVPLTFAAGLVHWQLGNIDWNLLGALLIGSVPAILIGSRFTKKVPNHIMQPCLALALLALGVYYTLFK